MDGFQLPEGVGDSLPEYMYRRIALEEKLSHVFFKCGYDPVDTSVLENAETYRGAVGAVEDKRLFHFQDTDGNMVVLRADMTLPLSRIAATKLPSNYPLRLSYISPSFNLTTPKKHREREFRQAGVELFGVSGAAADAEVVSIAVEALLAAGLTEFQIDMGQVGIVKGILETLPEEKQLEIVSFIDKKNLLSEDLGLPKTTVDVLNAVISLYGEGEVLDAAEELLQPFPSSLRALNNLKEVFGMLKERGFDKYLSIDLGLVNSYSYYSGVVFKGMTAAFGDSILGGGRYDRLLENYGKKVSATGMAIGIRSLLTAASVQTKKPPFPATDVAVGGVGQGETFAAAHARQLRADGVRAVDSFATTKDGLEKFARRVYAERAVFFNADGTDEVIL